MPLVRVGRLRLILNSVSEVPSNKPRRGGARASSSRFVLTKLVLLLRWLRVFKDHGIVDADDHSERTAAARQGPTAIPFFAFCEIVPGPQ